MNPSITFTAKLLYDCTFGVILAFSIRNADGCWKFIQLTQRCISLSRVCISLSQRWLSCTRLVRRLSQICPTAVEHIFDGRRTKPERLMWEVRVTVLEEGWGGGATYTV